MGQRETRVAGGAGAASRALARDALAGLVAAVVLIANMVSFAALMFPGPLAAGTATVIWAMLVGSGVSGLWIAWKTSLPPLSTGIDAPTGAVLVLLAAGAGPAVLAAGGNAQTAIQATMALFTAATVVSGALLLGLGSLRWGSYLRFVPYFVVAGFLGATGWLLIAGGVRMSTGRTLQQLWSPWAAPELARLACAVLVLGVLLAVRRWGRSPFALPFALLLMAALGGVLLKGFGATSPAQGWYLPSLGALLPWSPLDVLRHPPLPLAQALAYVPELLAVAIVALVSLVTKTSSLEVTRKTAANLDLELRAHGLATLAVAPLGGIVGSMQLGSSRLLESAGGATRASGMACAAVLALVGLANFDLPALIPVPIAAGLVFQLGYGFLVEAFARPLAQRAWWSLAMALAIMLACVRFGYLAGVIGGVVCACLLFAASYARTGVVRQHLSRAQFAGNVSRSAQASGFLVARGEAIQIYWLSGYIFFGSSDGVFERVRRDVDALPPGQVGHVILDFSMVTGVDTSATMSLAKLRNYCRQQHASLSLSGVAGGIRCALERDGFFDGQEQAQPFGDVCTALAWAEDSLLAQAGPTRDAGSGGFEPWLQQQLGPAVAAADFMPYLARRSVVGGQVLYREGEAADDIDLVAEGSLVVEIRTPAGPALRVRSITTHTVVGEMGFFRSGVRSATILTEGPATLFTLSRASFARLRQERPELASAFYEFLLRTLAERISVSERTAVALAG